MTPPDELVLARPRDLSALVGDSLRMLLRHFWTFVALSAVVVVPVHLIVSGIGLEQLSADYDSSPTVEETIIPTGVSFLVIAPLINAICIYALHSVAEGGQPRPGRSIVEGFEAFRPIFLAILLAAFGIAAGLLFFILPGIFLAVRWYFVPQAVVIEDARGPGALTRSWRLTDGFWWRTFGILVVGNLIALLPALVLSAPLAAVAESTDRAVWSLIGSMATETLTAPFLALLSTLLYYDLRARRRQVV
ncbi:MAG TPA: hypothetical protein VHG69_14260 [Thermoleophilaceae bacterium]|nr:hypothetical protein [Thermoleophilaceae bacterium]